MLSISKKDLVEYIAILSILLTSKSTFFLLNNSICLPIFFFIAILFAWKRNSLFNANSSIVFLILLYILYIYNSIYHNSFRITFFIFPLGTYLIMSCIEIENFRRKFFNIAFIIALLSIIVYVGHLFHFISPHFPPGKDDSNSLWLWHGFNFVNPYSWFILHRHAGFFHEPGAYQIILNLSLLFNLSHIANGEKRTMFKVCIILLALLLTMSTNAYLSSLLILAVAFKDKIMTSKYLAIPLLVVFICICAYILTSDVVIEKFSNQNEVGSSAYIRKNDMIACLRMFFEHPLLGVGNGDDFTSYSLRYNNVSSSNGILAELARLGIFWLILYFTYFVKAAKRISQNNRLHKWAIIIICTMLFSNEDMMGFPLAYLLIFKFKDQAQPSKFIEET